MLHTSRSCLIMCNNSRQYPLPLSAFVKLGQLNKIMAVSSNQRRFMQNSVASHCLQFILPPGHTCPLSMPPWSSFHKASTNSNQFLIARFKEFGTPHSSCIVFEPSMPFTICSFCDCHALHGGKCWQHTTRKISKVLCQATLHSHLLLDLRGKHLGHLEIILSLRIDALRTYLSSYIALPNHEQVAWSSTVFFKQAAERL